MKDHKKYVLYAILLSILAVWVRVGWVAFYPYIPFEVHSITILDADNTVRAGDDLLYVTDYTKHMELPAEVRRQLIDGYVINIPAAYGNVPLGRNKTINSIRIPEFTDAGSNYRIEISYTHSTPMNLMGYSASLAGF